MTLRPHPPPSATYRLQLHAGFDFADAERLLPYLARMGVTTLYTSPCLQAAEGSTHGYDVVDHGRLNEDLGGEEGYTRLSRALASHGMDHLLDIVPNHMCVTSRRNGWWWDVLESGPASIHADAFDIDWGREDDAEPTVLVPVLGDHFGRVLEKGEVKLVREGSRILVRYHEHVLPVAPGSLYDLLSPAAHASGSAELRSLSRAARSMPVLGRPTTSEARESHRQKLRLQSRLARLLSADPEACAALDAALGAVNADPDRLEDFLHKQPYRLAYWRTASEQLDYRRFFNIEALVGLRVEDEEVFAESHRRVLALIASGQVSGLRVDHIDGLRDPRSYLERLREATAGTYTVVEKILELDEELPDDWPVEGTSGYDFLARVSNLLVDPSHEAALDATYAEFTGERTSYVDVVYAAKRHVMTRDLRAEVDSLTRLLSQVCEQHRRHRDHTRRELREALEEFLAALPVYRTYVQPAHAVSAHDERTVAQAVARARERRPDIDAELLSFLGELSLLAHAGPRETDLAVRLAQVSGPVMAKGVEDTAFYRYHRLISLNEVGGNPGVFGRDVEAFHTATANTARRFPGALLTLSTHDTKRSADVRARLHLLSELPEAWADAVRDFATLAASHRETTGIDRQTEYLLYQSLVGAWPIELPRVQAFLEKATREAKVHTSWIDPDPTYDACVRDFAREVLGDARFCARLEAFLRAHRIVERGRVNSLAQTTLLLTCPGVPDIYQGSELWRLSLVDPDNRRPVDFELRARCLAQLEARGLESLTPDDDETGLCKLWLMTRLLQHRREHPALYARAGYAPLFAEGARARHVVAFARGPLVTVVPRLVVGLEDGWQETRLRLPKGRYREVIGTATIDGGDVALSDLLARFPVSVLHREEG